MTQFTALEAWWDLMFTFHLELRFLTVSTGLGVRVLGTGTVQGTMELLDQNFLLQHPKTLKTGIQLQLHMPQEILAFCMIRPATI